MLKKGQRIYAVQWGMPMYGTVAKDQTSGVVFVQFDGKEHLTWMHGESLTVVA